MLRGLFSLHTKCSASFVPSLLHSKSLLGGRSLSIKWKLKDPVKTSPRKTAGMMVIGDELLNGQMQDTNSNIVARFLFEQGVKLRRMVVVSDEIEEISTNAKEMSSRYDFVITSGGVGGTLDDRTYEAIALAFGLTQRYHEETLEKMYDYYLHRGVPLNESRKKMAFMPYPAEFIEVPGMWRPVVVVNRNVYVLTGVSRVFERMLEACRGRFKGKRAHRRLVYTNMMEGDFACDLVEAEQRFPDVRIGSYPTEHTPLENVYTVMLTFEGEMEEDVDYCAEYVKNRVNGTYTLDAETA